MLNDRTYLGLGSVLCFLQFGERRIASAFLIREIQSLRRLRFDLLLLPGISGVTPHARFITMQEMFDNLTVMCIRRRNSCRMNEAGFAIHTNMALHAELPLIAFLGLTHFWISFLLLVFRRGRCSNNRGVNYRTASNLQSSLGQVPVDLTKQLIAQMVLFQQMTEVQYCRFIGNWFTSQINAHKLAHRGRIVEGFFHTRV